MWTKFEMASHNDTKADTGEMPSKFQRLMICQWDHWKLSGKQEDWIKTVSDKRGLKKCISHAPFNWKRKKKKKI